MTGKCVKPRFASFQITVCILAIGKYLASQTERDIKKDVGSQALNMTKDFVLLIFWYMFHNIRIDNKIKASGRLVGEGGDCGVEFHPRKAKVRGERALPASVF